MNRHLWQDAAALAARAHKGQKRKDEETPYISHPVRVALTTACVFGFTDETILAAALLHDVIEDTDTDYDDLHKKFGPKVADIVAALTKDMRMIEPKREVAYDRQLAAGPWEARLIKLADVYDNLQDPTSTSPLPKLLAKADRAIALTRRDRKLDDAREIVAALRNSMAGRKRRKKAARKKTRR